MTFVLEETTILRIDMIKKSRKTNRYFDEWPNCPTLLCGYPLWNMVLFIVKSFLFLEFILLLQWNMLTSRNCCKDKIYVLSLLKKIIKVLNTYSERTKHLSKPVLVFVQHLPLAYILMCLTLTSSSNIRISSFLS